MQAEEIPNIVHLNTGIVGRLAVPSIIRYSFTIFSPSQTPDGQACIADINNGEEKQIRLPDTEIYFLNELI